MGFGQTRDSRGKPMSEPKKGNDPNVQKFSEERRGQTPAKPEKPDPKNENELLSIKASWPGRKPENH